MIEKRILESIAVKQRLLDSKDLIQAIDEAAQAMIQTFNQSGKILLCGNGGSAGDAQHIAAELSGRFYYDRLPLYAEALHVNTSYLTAVANDYGYEFVYSRMVEAAGKKGDLLVGISTSGGSKNVANAMASAREKGMLTIALTGEKHGIMHELADISIMVPSFDTPRIQECHILIGHIWCEMIESTLFPK